MGAGRLGPGVFRRFGMFGAVWRRFISLAEQFFGAAVALIVTLNLNLFNKKICLNLPLHSRQKQDLMSSAAPASSTERRCYGLVTR